MTRRVARDGMRELTVHKLPSEQGSSVSTSEQ